MLITFQLHNPGVYINIRFQKKLLRKIFLTILRLNLSKPKTSFVLFNLKVCVKNIVPPKVHRQTLWQTIYEYR